MEWPTWAGAVCVVQSSSTWLVHGAQDANRCREKGDPQAWGRRGAELPKASRIEAWSTGKVAKPTFVICCSVVDF